MRLGLIAATTIALLTIPARADSLTPGEGWQNIYLEDFSDTQFVVGTNRHKYCVEQALLKADELKRKGGTVGSLIQFEEAVQLVGKTAEGKQVVIACSAQGVLAIFYKAPGSLADIFDAMNAIKIEPKVQPVDTGGAPPPAKAAPADASAPAQ